MVGAMRRMLPAILLMSLACGPVAAQPWASEPARAAGRQALAAAQAGRFPDAQALAQAADPLAAKLVTWLRLLSRDSGAGAAELVAWLGANPDWPFPVGIAARAEEMLANEPDDALVLRHFARIPPRGLAGADRLAAALTRAGRGAEAAAALREAWREGPPDDPAVEAAFAERHAAILTADDHARRFDRLLWQEQAGPASRLVPRLDPARRAAAEARLALRAGREPEGAAGIRDLGVMHERARLLRRADRDAEAAAVWAAAEPLQTGMPPEAARDVWTERQILARKLLRLGDPATAYRVARGHGQTEPGEPRQEAEFLAGFIALRRLDDAAGALAHFARVAEDSRSVITRARSAYWEGLALTALGRTAEARTSWEEAAALPVAFYGQLASLALGETPQRLAARIAGAALPAPSREAADHFAARELVRAAVTLADLGQSDRARTFLLRMEEVAPDAADRWLIARLGVLIGRPDHAVWIARRSGADGVVLLEDGWPTPYAAPAEGAEAALVHAITRQESNFELGAVSRANARGPMQLLPGTARQVARRLGIRHSTGMLTSDPEHNLRLGAAYIAEMLDRFGGALPLAAAAYNAGPRRVDEWLGTYGDPRVASGPHILDWMEMIPFGETRNYVQRVIENVVIYRARDTATADLPHPLAGLLR